MMPLHRTLALLVGAFAVMVASTGQTQVSRLNGSVDPDLATHREALEKDLEAIAVIERRVMIPMRDGTLLATDIYRPRDDSKHYPAVFVGTPYEMSFWDAKLGAPRDMTKVIDAIKRGYAYVIQNYRGTFYSEGIRNTLYPPLTDWQDSFSWLAKQPWSNGRLAPVGCSSLGEWIPAVGAAGHPALAAMVPEGYSAGLGGFGPYHEQGNLFRGGAVQSEMLLFMYEDQFVDRPLLPRIGSARLTAASRYFDLSATFPGVDWNSAIWHLPFADVLPFVQAPRGITTDVIEGAPGKPLLDRPAADAEWRDQNFYDSTMGMRTPGLWMASWYDLAVAPNIEAFKHAVASADPDIAPQQHLVVFPERHCHINDGAEHTVVGARDVGDARLDTDELIWSWMDQYLKGIPSPRIAGLPRYTYFVMGKGWETSDAWPPRGSRPLTLYLASKGHANSLTGDGTLQRELPARGSDTFRYDPRDPVPSKGGGVCCMAIDLLAGSFDQRTVEERPDVLVYTTAILSKGLEVSGPVTVKLYISSDRTDTDFTAKLIDVYPDGRAFNLDNSIERVRYRDGYETPHLMTPGKVYPITIGPMVTSNWFAPGHRLRIEISSSNFPQFERNLNRGDDNLRASEPLIAENRVFHSAVAPSSVTLSVVGH
jgi:uncharacterized protein